MKQKCGLCCFLCLAGVLVGSAIAQGIDSEPELRFACWGSFGPPVVSAQCPRNTIIQVRRAGLKVHSRGGHCTFSDDDCGCEFGEDGCNMPNVREVCMGRPACRLDVTQQYINSETCQGFSDYMFIQFSCVPARKASNQDICSTAATSHEQGFLHSPNYPHSYPINRQCECSLSSPEGSTLSLSLLDLHTEDETCEHSSLVLSHDGQQRKICNGGDQQLVEGSTKVDLSFNTDGQSGKGGFWIKYEALPPSSIKITCRSVYKAPPTTTTTELRTEPSAPPDDDLTTPSQNTAPSSEAPPRRPKPPMIPATPTTQKDTTTPEPTTQKMPFKRRRPISRGVQSNVHAAPETRTERPKPTAWWWKYTQKPTEDVPQEIKAEDLVPFFARDDEEDDELFDNVDNEIGIPDQRLLGIGIPSNKLNQIPQDSPPTVAGGGMDPNNPSSANVLAPLMPSTNSKAGKFPSPSSVQIWLKTFNRKKQILAFEGMPATIEIAQQKKPIPEQEQPMHAADASYDKAQRMQPQYADPNPPPKPRSWYPAQKNIHSQNMAKQVKHKAPEVMGNDLPHLAQGHPGQRGQMYDINWEGVNSQVFKNDNTWSRIRKQNLKPNIAQSKKVHAKQQAGTEKTSGNYGDNNQWSKLPDDVLSIFRVGNHLNKKEEKSSISRKHHFQYRSHGLKGNEVTSSQGQKHADRGHIQGHTQGQGHRPDSSFITESVKDTQTHGDIPANVSHVADQRSKPENQGYYGEENSLTVTIVAACVIGGILLIIVVGILVRFMINKADPRHQMRQMHKKECVLRRNAKILNRSAKGKSFA